MTRCTILCLSSASLKGILDELQPLALLQRPHFLKADNAPWSALSLSKSSAQQEDLKDILLLSGYFKT